MAAADNAPSRLSGTATGSWQAQPGNPDVGVARTLKGHGRFTIGPAKVRGTVTAPGFIAAGACRVRLRLVTHAGAVRIVGHSSRTSGSYGNCLDPFRFRFHTKSGSGAFTDVSYSGTGHLDLDYQSTDVTDQGPFLLRLRR